MPCTPQPANAAALCIAVSLFQITSSRGRDLHPDGEVAAIAGGASLGVLVLKLALGVAVGAFLIFVGLKRYFISTISNHSLSVQLRVLTAETMEISASLNKLVVVKGQAGSTEDSMGTTGRIPTTSNHY